MARRFLAGVGLAVGLAWLFRRLRKPRPAPAADPAGELKQRLAESRAAEPDRPDEEPEAEPEPPLDQRRRAVHERARASIDEMRGRGTPPQP